MDAPREAVFDAIAHPERWPEWWRGVVSARQHDPGDEDGIGRRGEIVWRAPLGYRVRFTIEALKIERPVLLEARAEGDLTGTGTWRFGESSGATDAVFEWRVRADKPLMRAAGPLLRPILVWNHDWLMATGEAGLGRYLSQ